MVEIRFPHLFLIPDAAPPAAALAHAGLGEPALPPQSVLAAPLPLPPPPPLAIAREAVASTRDGRRLGPAALRGFSRRVVGAGNAGTRTGGALGNAVASIDSESGPGDAEGSWAQSPAAGSSTPRSSAGAAYIEALYW